MSKPKRSFATLEEVQAALAQSKKPQPPKILKLLVANGVLLEAPVWEKHSRGSNWLAIIDIDASMPGGLARRFLSRGKGECLYVIEQLALFDPVEFAADYTTSYGDKRKDRWFGIVTALTEGHLLVEEATSGVKAVLRSKEARTSARDRASALKAERDELVAKAAKLEAEIQSLEEEVEIQVEDDGGEPAPSATE